MPLTDRALSQTGIVADHEKRLRRMRFAKGFDPNEDPVIIGAGATAGGGSTPDNGAGAHLHPVSIGRGTSVTGDYGVAVCTHGTGETSTVGANGFGAGRAVTVGANGVGVGYGATAGQHGVTVGWGTTAGDYDTTIGDSATATGGYGLAAGQGANCTADSGSAVGTVSEVHAVSGTAVGVAAQVRVGHDNSTAVGANARTGSAHQIMLGTSLETVVMPGNFYAGDLPTTDPGVTGLVWSNAGVLTVSP